MISPYFLEAHEVFRQTVRQFLRKEVVPNAETWEERERIPRNIWHLMGEHSLLGINYPEIFGGLNADFMTSVVFLEELARHAPGGFAGAVCAHQFMAMTYIYKFASQPLKKNYLVPGILGEKVGALAITEPGTGSDLAALETRAELSNGVYVINGTKNFITNGIYGDFLVVAAKTKPRAGTGGISLFVVDADARGLSARKLSKIGWRCADTAEIRFHNVKVPESQRIGRENLGFYYIMDCFLLERLISAVLAVAGSDAALDATLEYIHQREAFNRPLAKFQVIRHTLADLAAEVEASRQLTYNACWQYQNGHKGIQYATMAKLYAGELSRKVADACLQYFGAYGLTDEPAISRIFRDSRAGTISGGTSEIMREIIARLLIDNAARPDKASRPPQPAAKPAGDETPVRLPGGGTSPNGANSGEKKTERLSAKSPAEAPAAAEADISDETPLPEAPLEDTDDVSEAPDNDADTTDPGDAAPEAETPVPESEPSEAPPDVAKELSEAEAGLSEAAEVSSTAQRRSDHPGAEAELSEAAEVSSAAPEVPSEAHEESSEAAEAPSLESEEPFSQLDPEPVEPEAEIELETESETESESESEAEADVTDPSPVSQPPAETIDDHIEIEPDILEDEVLDESEREALVSALVEGDDTSEIRESEREREELVNALIENEDTAERLAREKAALVNKLIEDRDADAGSPEASPESTEAPEPPAPSPHPSGTVVIAKDATIEPPPNRPDNSTGEAQPMQDRSAVETAAAPAVADLSVTGIIESLPERFRGNKAGKFKAVIHYKISGLDGGEYTARIENEVCEVFTGLKGRPSCVVETNVKTFIEMETGKTNPQIAFMMGNLRISNVPEMMAFIKLLKKLPDT